MHKLLPAAAFSLLALSACGTDEEIESTTSGENTDQNQNEEQSNPEDTNTGSDESEANEAPTAEEIMEEAVAFYDDLDSLYFVVEGENEMNLDGDQENVPEGNVTTTTKETQWDYVRDGTYYNRLELDVTTEGEENGESFSEEEPTSYQFTDLNDPTYTITYDEGDEEAIRYDAGRDTEGYDMSQGAAPYEQLLEEADLTYVGEEEINGYDTYHIQTETEEGSSEYWFDQETYYEIKSERETSADEEHAAGDATSNMEVVDFEVNPAFDESLFQAPEDIDVVDGDLEDTVGNE